MSVQSQQGMRSMKQEMGFKSWQQSRAQGLLAWMWRLPEIKEGKGLEGSKETTLEAFGLSGKLAQLGIVLLTQSPHFFLIFLRTWW